MQFLFRSNRNDEDIFNQQLQVPYVKKYFSRMELPDCFANRTRTKSKQNVAILMAGPMKSAN